MEFLRTVRGEAMKGLAPIRGRGASANVANRFEQIDYVPDDEHGELDPHRPRTLFLRDASKSIIVYNDSPDVGFDASINPYRDASMGASIVTRGRRMSSWVFRRVWILRRGSW